MKVRTLVALAATLASAAALSATPAFAASSQGTATSAVTATIVGTNLTGTRTLSAGPTAIAAVNGTNQITGSLPATVVETNVAGVSPWTVTAQLAGPLTDSSGDSIAASSVSTGTTTITPTTSLLTGQADASGTAGAMNNAVTLYNVTGETATNFYTNTFTSSTPLSMTLNGVPAGTYTGTIDLTLLY